MFEYAFDKNNSITREVHDFNTGLKYVTNEKTGECEIRKIGLNEDLDGLDTTSSGTDIKLKDPTDFFSFDQEKFQFTGYVIYLFLFNLIYLKFVISCIDITETKRWS